MPYCRWWLTGHPARSATTCLRLARGWRWRFCLPPGCALARAASLPYCDPASNHTAITQNTHRALVVPAVCRVVCRVPVRESCALPPAWGAGARELATRAEWETEQEQQKSARSEALESARRSGSTRTRRALSARALGEFTAAFAARGGCSAVVSRRRFVRRITRTAPSLRRAPASPSPRSALVMRTLAERRAARTPRATTRVT